MCCNCTHHDFEILLTTTISPVIFYSWIIPGFIVGLGRASNTTSNYYEVPLNNHAASSLDYFSKNTEAQLAYEVGAVLDYSFNDLILECAYRYIDAGHGWLGLSSLQNTNDQLSTGPLHYHAISIGVRLHHAF